MTLRQSPPFLYRGIRRLRMLKLTWSQVAAWRVRRHHLDRRAPGGGMLAVARRLCGLHAQLMSSAELTVWARVEDLDRRAVQRALWQERALVKTWAMRGTLHLLPAADLPLWHAALGTSRRRHLKPAVLRYLGITREELDRLTEAIAIALDGRVMTREELAQDVGRLTGSAALGAKLALGSWSMVLKPAAFTGRLCFGPSLGQRVRYTRPDTWLSAAPPSIDSQAALAAITRWYLAAYGPATYHDFARWWGGAGVSAAGLDFARPVGQWFHGRRMALRNQGDLRPSHHRAVCQDTGVGATRCRTGSRTSGGISRPHVEPGLEELTLIGRS